MSRVTSPIVGLCMVFTLLISLVPAPASALSRPQDLPLDPPAAVLALAHYYVDAVQGSNATGDGSQAAPWQTITHALGQVSGPDVEIHVAPGVYNSALGETFPIVMEPGISLLGSGYTATSLVAGGTGYVVHFPNTAVYTATTVISGFEIANGNTGVRVDGRTGTGQTPTIQANWITTNTYGITNYATAYQRADPTIRGNLISANSAYGIYNYAGYLGTRVSPTIESNQIVDNGSVGIYMYVTGAGSSGDSNNSFSSPVIRDNLIARNHSHGLQCTSNYAGACGPLLSHNVIADNTGWGYTRSHSGSYLVTCQPKFVNDLIYGNSSGGVYAISSSSHDDLPLFVNSTVVGNGSYGIRNGKPTLANTIVWGQTDNLNVATSYVSYSDIGDGEYGGTNHNLSVDPQFASPADDDYHLLPSSPVIDAGDSAYSGLPSTDMDGDLRILGPAVGMGADETAPYSISIGKAVQAAPPVYPGDTLTYTLAVTNAGPGSAAGVLVTDVLPAGTSWNGVLQASGGSPGMSAGQVTWQGTMLLGHRETITFGVTTGQGLAWGEPIANTAVVANRTGSITESLPAVVDAAPAAFWAASRQAVDDPYPVPGQRLVYTLLISNTGNASGMAVVTDTLDGNVTFAQASTGGLPALGTVTWSGVGLAPGAHVALTLAVTVNVPLTDGMPIGNAVRVAGGSSEPFDLPPAGVVVFNPPVPDFGAVPRSGASPLTVSFADASQRATSYLWSYGDGTTGTTPGSHDHTYTEAGVYTVTLRVANLAAAATLTRTHYITVAQGPEPGFEAAPLVGTAPLTVWFTNTSEHATEFLWDYGDGLTSTVTATLHAHTYAQAGSYRPALTAINNNGSFTAALPGYIMVYQPVTAGFDGSPLIGLAPLAVQFINSSSGATSYHWTFGDGATSQASDPEHIYQAVGVYTVTLTAANLAAAATLTRSHYITVAYSPEPGFEAAPLLGTTPLTVWFTNTSEHATEFLWDYGDGLTSTVTATLHAHTYAQAGWYRPALTAINDNGSFTVALPGYVMVYQPVTAGFDGSPLIGPAPLAVQFTNSSSGATSYQWTFGDGATSQESDPEHIYQAAGVYTVTLTAANPADQDVEVRPAYVTVQQPPQVAFEGQPLIGIAPLVVTFVNSTQDADWYLWSYGDGLTSTVAAISHTHTYTAPGFYDVTLTAGNAYATRSLLRPAYVAAYLPVTAAFDAAPRVGLGPLTVQFYNQSSGATTYFWTFGDGASSTEFEPAHTYGSPGRYRVSLQASNPADSDTLARGDYIVVCGPALADFSGSPTLGVTPMIVTFANNAQHADTLLWDYGDGVTSTTTSQFHSHVYLDPGVFTVTLTAANACGADTLARPGYVLAYAPPLPSDYYVDVAHGSDLIGAGTQEKPWRSITHALALVSGPDTRIHVAPGEYNTGTGEVFPLVMEPGVSVLGAGYGTTTLSGISAQYVVLFPGATTYGTNTVLNGFKIEHGLAGVRVVGALGTGSTPTVENNWITDNSDGVRNLTDPSTRIYAVYRQNLIANNSVIGIRNQADATENCDDGFASPIIDGNQILNNGSAGISCYAYGWSKLDRGNCNPTITGNLIAGNGGSGFQTYAEYAGMISPQIVGNIIRDNARWGFEDDEGPSEYWTSNQPRLIGNLIYDNHLGGAVFFISDVGLSLNNTIVDNYAYGIQRIGPSYGYRSFPVTVVNNIVWGHTDDLKEVAPAYVSYSDIGEPGYGGLNNNISADPGFVNRPGDDYHILPSGPGVDAGDSDYPGVPATDIDGEQRIVGAAVDMGADEVPLYLGVNKTASPDPVISGGVITYTLYLSNGSNVALHAHVLDLLPDHVTPGGMLSWSPVLSTGQVWTETVRVTVEAGYVGPLINQLLATADEGASGQDQEISTVVDAPIAGLLATSDSPTPLGSATALTATVAAGTNVTFTWAFGDGQGGSGSALSHLYAAPGLYTAVVAAANPTGVMTATTVVTVQIAVGRARRGQRRPHAAGQCHGADGHARRWHGRHLYLGVRRRVHRRRRHGHARLLTAGRLYRHRHSRQRRQPGQRLDARHGPGAGCRPVGGQRQPDAPGQRYGADGHAHCRHWRYLHLGPGRWGQCFGRHHHPPLPGGRHLHRHCHRRQRRQPGHYLDARYRAGAGCRPLGRQR